MINMDRIMQQKEQAGLRIVALVCARGGSKGVPRKNIRPLAGKPLIVHTIEAAKACPFFDAIVISTDDEEIAAIAREAGAIVPMLRPAELASDTAGKFDVFVHAIGMIDSHFGAKTDILVDLDVTTPFRDANDIRACVQVMLDHPETDSAVTATISHNNPYFNMFEADEQGYIHVSKKLETPIVRRQDAPMVYQLNAAVLAMRRSALLEKKKIYTDKSRVCVIDDDHAVMIDSQTDFAFAEFLAARGNHNSTEEE